MPSGTEYLYLVCLHRVSYVPEGLLKFPSAPFRVFSWKLETEGSEQRILHAFRYIAVFAAIFECSECLGYPMTYRECGLYGFPNVIRYRDAKRHLSDLRTQTAKSVSVEKRREEDAEHWNA